MKVIKNYWKSCLCFLLAFLCIISSIFYTNFLNASVGGGVASVPPNLNTGSSEGENEGVLTTQTTFYRITAAVVDQNNNYIYSDNGDGSMSTLASAHSQVDPDGTYTFSGSHPWIYVASDQVAFKPGGRTCWYYSEVTGSTYAVHVSDGGDTDGDWGTLKSILGISDVDDNAENLNTAFKALSDDSEKQAAALFGIDADATPNYIFIVEQLRSYGTALTEAGYHIVMASHFDDIKVLVGLASSSEIDSMFNGYNAYQTDPIYGFSSVADSVNDFFIYSNHPVESGNKSLANISVTYTGEPNTSDADKFRSEATVGGYVDGALKSWNGSAWDSEFKLNMTRVDSNYTMMFAGISSLNASADVSVNSIIEHGNNLGSFTLNWGTTEVTGDIHAGVTTKVTGINNYASTQAISSKMTISGITVNHFSDTTNGNNPVGDDGIRQVIQGTYTKAANNFSSDKALSKSGTLKSGKSLGLGTEFIVRGASVESDHYIITIHDDGTSSVDHKPVIKYNTACSGGVVTDDNAIALVVAQRTPNNQNSDHIKSGLNAQMTPQDVLNTVVGNLNGRISAQTTAAGSRSVSVGHDTSNSNNGYVIYEVVAGDAGTEKILEGTTELEDWFLNKYTNDILETAYKKANGGNPFYLAINTTHTVWKDDSCYTTADCGERLLVRTNKDYNTVYKLDKSGTELDWDTNAQKIYYPASASDKFPGSDSTFKFPVTIDTLNYSGNRTLDFAFNFVRSSVDDTRSISGISYGSYSEIGDTKDYLKISNKFGVVPTVKTTSVGRAQVVGTITETLKFSSIFERTGSENGYKDGQQDTHGREVYRYDTVTDSETGATYQVPVYCSYIDYLHEPVSNKNAGLIFNISATNKITYNLTGIVYKYQTAELAEGKNSFLEGVDMHALGINANKPAGATKKNTNEYRYATVHRNAGVDLKFYPENYMVYKIGGTVFDSAPYKYAAVMSEVKRTSESSSLYLFKINTDVEDENSVVTGSTYSDTMQGGTSSFGKNQVSIPAGSDVTVLADATNIKLDLYGYALDLIDGSKDSTMSIGAGSNKTYNSVVKSGENVASAWGNASDHSEKLKSNFITWADNILQVENFGADFVLKVNNQVKGANFSATVGKVNHTSGAVEDGVYNIVVENGEIVKSAGAYNNMIQQIAADYDCSTAEAETIFTDSQIYTAIMNAIESSTSNFNTSGQATGVAESWTSTLGNANNWYDEKVRTFVVRRYTNLGNTLSDITATDKLDYSLAPNGDDSGKENAGAGTTFNANWYLNIFFNSARKDTVDSLLLENGTYYDPSVSTDISGANNAYSVLIKENHVRDADFLIPASSTSSFGF